jgi:hypothetical protein
VSAVDPSRPDGIARRAQSGRTADTAAVPAGCGSTPRSGHPGLDNRPRPGSAAAVDTGCAGWCPPPSPAGRAWTVGRLRPPCPRPAQGLQPCPRRRAAVRPAPGRNPGRPAARPWCPVPRTPRGCGPGRRRWQTSAVQCATANAACGHRQPAGGRRCGHPRVRQGHADTAEAALMDSRQRNRPLPLACPTGNGTASCGTGQHRHGPTADPWPGAPRRSGRLQTDLGCSGWVRRRSRQVQMGPVGSSG